MSHRSTTNSTSKFSKDKRNRQREQLSKRLDRNQDRMDATQPQNRLAGRLGQPNQSSSSSSFGKGGSVAGGGSGPRRNGGGSAGGSTNRANSTVVKVDGFTGAINETDFISFVRRHVPRVHLSKFSIEAGSVLLTLRTIGEAQAVAKLRRLTYNQDTINFALYSESRVLVFGEQKKALLTQLMGTRFNPETQELDLSGIKSSLELANANITVNFNNTSFVTALLKLVNELMPELSGLRVSHNEITQLTAFAQLHLLLPKVTKLDLSDNKIPNLRALDSIKNVKVLQQLFVQNNPLMSTPEAKNLKSDLARKFPALQVLNGEQVQTMQFGLPLDVVDAPLLPKEQENFFDQESTQDATITFARRFFELFDKQRQDLLVAYADNACFSVAVAKTPQRHGFKEAPSPEYVRNSRNLKMESITNESKEWDRRVKLVQRGPAEILSFFTKSMPRTVHALDTFRVDAWQQLEGTPLLFIFFHGDFDEYKGNNPTPVKRSFDRTFVLTPNPPNSPASRAGWPVQIVNDQLIVRSYSGRFVPAIDTAPSKPAAASNTPDVVQELMKVTRMNREYSAQCLQDNGMDFERALVMFKNLQASGQIPQAAFV